MTEADTSSGMINASVLICSRNRPEMLADVVRSVSAGSALPRELVVVDQSAAPNELLTTLALGQGAELRYLHRPGRGLSLARNIALRAATSDRAVLLDDDMFVHPDWLRTLVGPAQDDSSVVRTGRVLAAPDEGSGYGVPPAALVTTATPDVYRGRQARDVVPGANVSLDRALVLELGGFDERLGAGSRYCSADDNDMGLRLLAAGCEVRHVPEAVVFHRAWRSPPEQLRLRWGYGRGKGAFYTKHLSLRDTHMTRRMVTDVARHLYRGVANVLRAPDVAAGEAVYVAGLLSAAMEWLIRERGGRRFGYGTPS